MKFMILVVLVIVVSSNLYGDTYGKLLLYGNCITCHHETKNISAPSLQIIKKRYKEAFPEKEQFVEYMSNWVLNPDKNTSIMIDMINKYELMPHLGYDKDTLKKIATYIYHYEIQ
jgi:hypothetical protein